MVIMYHRTDRNYKAATAISQDKFKLSENTFFAREVRLALFCLRNLAAFSEINHRYNTRKVSEFCSSKER